ncbi:hypothetical protein B0H15DRAFT_142795 [Mycena belliarum]|uniref:Uncharacterized protein n=1 Tax=Mycena belliarum TaxID=1033014 RepID=A0AAD6U785_9AGAR|nr:hypothetical protein B0H15DRAFT_142795 [Mycena belliae]
MFQPFQSVADFYPGLIVWCDPAGLDSIDRDPSKLGLGFLYDCKKSRDLRPCLVISVDYSAETFEAARLSASTPADPSQWAQIDSPPPITWKLNDAWIWIGELPTIPMVFDNAKVMHRTSALSSPSRSVQARLLRLCSEQGRILQHEPRRQREPPELLGAPPGVHQSPAACEER